MIYFNWNVFCLNKFQIPKEHLPVWIRMCPLSCPLLEKATSQCGHLNFFGRCFLAVIIFTWASSASTRAYSCSITNGSTPMNGKFGNNKSWYVDDCGWAWAKNGVVGKNPGTCWNGITWFVSNLFGGTLFTSIVCPSAMLLDFVLVSWPNGIETLSLIRSKQFILLSRSNFELSGVALICCCDCIVVEVIVLSWLVFPSQGRNKREYVCGGDNPHLADIFNFGFAMIWLSIQFITNDIAQKKINKFCNHYFFSIPNAQNRYFSV